MRKLLLLAASLAALWSCDKSEPAQPAQQEPLMTTKATNVTGYITVATIGTMMQAHITFSPAISTGGQPFLVYFTMHKVYITQNGFTEYTSASVETLIDGTGNYSENVPGHLGSYTYIPISSIYTVNMGGRFNINWVVNNLPTYDTEPDPGPGPGSGCTCGGKPCSCPSTCSCGCQAGSGPDPGDSLAFNYLPLLQ